MTTRPATLLSLNDAAAQLGVHYMTAYRYVRTGQLEARRERSRWVVDATAVERLLDGSREQPDPGRIRASRPTPTPARRRLQRCLVRGDERAAWRMVEDLLAAGMEAERVYLDVLSAAMRAVGDAWERGELHVGAEHAASTTAVRVAARLGPRFATRGRTRGTVILGTPPGERHSLPLTLLADPLRGRRFEVVDLGADVPTGSWGDVVAGADRLVAIGICATTASARAIRATLGAIDASAPGLPIVLGGHAAGAVDVARLTSVQVSSSAADALERFEALAGASALQRSRAATR